MTTYSETLKLRFPGLNSGAWFTDEKTTKQILEFVLVGELGLSESDGLVSGGAPSDGGGFNLSYGALSAVVNSSYVKLAASSIALSSAVTSFVFLNSSGSVAAATTPPVLPYIPIAVVDCDASGIVRIADVRSIRAWSFFSESPLRSRNVLRNGAMQVAQRGVSAAGVSTSGYQTCDRWFSALNSLGTFTFSQESASGPPGFPFSFKALVTSADASPAAGDYHYLLQRLEGFDVQRFKKGTSSAVPFALNFWVKSNVVGTYVVELVDGDNTRHVAASYSVASAGVWQKVSLVFPPDTSGVFDADNATSLSVRFWLGAGSTYTSGSLATSWAGQVDANRAVGQVNLSGSVSNYWQVSGVQLEAGPVSSSFEHLNFDDDLRACARYYYTNNVLYAVASAIGTLTVFNSFINFINTMRIAPVITISSVTLSANLGTYSALQQGRQRTNGFSPTFTVTGATHGAGGYSAFTFIADAEL